VPFAQARIRATELASTVFMKSSDENDALPAPAPLLPLAALTGFETPHD
jgi:hypothetical protein